MPTNAPRDGTSGVRRSEVAGWARALAHSASVLIFTFLNHWNEFLEPLVYLSSLEKYTLALGLRFFQTQPNDAQEPRDQLLMAASLYMTAPVLVLFFACQRYFIRGIVMSGIKG